MVARATIRLTHPHYVNDPWLAIAERCVDALEQVAEALAARPTRR
jgi:hypothetical protein